MGSITALALPPLATRLPDAEPDLSIEHSYWQFRELAPGGHDDYADRQDYDRVLELYIAADTPFSIQFLPGFADA